MELSEEMKKSFKNVFHLWSRAQEARGEAMVASYTFVYNLLKKVGPVKFVESGVRYEIAYACSEDNLDEGVGVIEELHIRDEDDEVLKKWRETHWGFTEKVMVKFVDGDEVEFSDLDLSKMGDLVYQVRDILNLDVRIFG